LELTAELDWLVNIEIKSYPQRPPALVDCVLELVDKTGTASRVLISSFDHRDIAYANRIRRGYALGILVDTPLYRVHEYVTEVVPADTVNMSAESLGSRSVTYRQNRKHSSLDGQVVQDLKFFGIPVLVYTVNDHESDGLARHLAEIGVAGLFTDDPLALNDLFRSTIQRAPIEPR
jgi:glycerophosphoryl diester phosphodiesterase